MPKSDETPAPAEPEVDAAQAGADGAEQPTADEALTEAPADTHETAEPEPEPEPEVEAHADPVEVEMDDEPAPMQAQALPTAAQQAVIDAVELRVSELVAFIKMQAPAIGVDPHAIVSHIATQLHAAFD